MNSVGIIPARLNSTRLPGKVLRPLNGKPMICHVWERVRKASKLDRVLVACDDPKVYDCVREFGGEAVMTRSDHPNGSSRIAEVAASIEADIVVNVQGDEPLIEPSNVDRIVQAFEEDASAQVVTLAVRGHEMEQFKNPNVVKVVCDERGKALYFSRAPIPHDRDGSGKTDFLKHIGIYGYRKSFLPEFAAWGSSRLEEVEKLEQLRILERGVSITVVETPHDSCGVDTEEDLQRVESALKNTD